jgi:hypothetical protein
MNPSVLKVRQIIPPLTARTLTGRILHAWDYKQKKSLLISFLHAGCRRCEDFVARLVACAAELTDREAVALVIFSEPPLTVAQDLPAQIVVATDSSGRAQRAYLGEDAFGPLGQQKLGVFVADRYGELYAQWVGASEEALPGAHEVLGWLAQIQLACEECGISHWAVEAT